MGEIMVLVLGEPGATKSGFGVRQLAHPDNTVINPSRTGKR